MRNASTLYKHTQFVLIAVCVAIFQHGISFGQQVSKSEVFPKAKFRHLLKSPATFTCDSSGDFNVVGMFYINKMPLADNQKIIWSCGIGQGDGSPVPYNEPVCSRLRIMKIYFFFDNEVYVFSFNGTLNMEAKKIYTTPQVVVIEYFDKDQRKTGYLKSTRKFQAGEVQ